MALIVLVIGGRLIRHHVGQTCPGCHARWAMRRTGATRNKDGNFFTGKTWEKEFRCRYCGHEMWVFMQTYSQ